MVGWHHRCKGHEFTLSLGDSEGQGSLACCSPWGRKELDTTERLNLTELNYLLLVGVLSHRVCFHLLIRNYACLFFQQYP